MKKLIAIDLDGTLLESKTKKISKTTFDYLKYLKQNGNIICIATRTIHEICINCGFRQ